MVDWRLAKGEPVDIAVDEPPVLWATKLVKRYAGVAALSGVDLQVRSGRVHALVGGNGSGKSTTVKILAGVERADAGTLGARHGTINATASSSAWAAANGVHVVHQASSTFPSLSVAENLAVGRYGSRLRVRWPVLRQRARAVLERLELDLDPDAPVMTLPRAMQTMVAIARAVQDGDQQGVLILDEPTAALPGHEVEVLLGHIRRAAGRGQAIVYVSHRLDEVLAVADECTVLRDGRVVEHRDVAGLTPESLSALIAGRALDGSRQAAAPAADSETVLRLDCVAVGPLASASLVVGAGEIVGLAGLLGSGRSELLHAVFGARPASGAMTFDGKSGWFATPAAAMAAGIAYVPEDRAVDGLFPEQSVSRNLAAAELGSYWRRGRMDRRQESSDGRRDLVRYGVRAANESVPVATLSGGNAQKVLIGRWLRRNPRLLLLDEPTQGVDVGARAELYGLVRDAASRGAGVVVASSDFKELCELADRVVVLRNGRTAEIVDTRNVDEATLSGLVYTADTSEPDGALV